MIPRQTMESAAPPKTYFIARHFKVDSSCFSVFQVIRKVFSSCPFLIKFRSCSFFGAGSTYIVPVVGKNTTLLYAHHAAPEIYGDPCREPKKLLPRKKPLRVREELFVRYRASRRELPTSAESPQHLEHEVSLGPESAAHCRKEVQLRALRVNEYAAGAVFKVKRHAVEVRSKAAGVFAAIPFGPDFYLIEEAMGMGDRARHRKIASRLAVNLHDAHGDRTDGLPWGEGEDAVAAIDLK